MSREKYFIFQHVVLGKAETQLMQNDLLSMFHTAWYHTALLICNVYPADLYNLAVFFIPGSRRFGDLSLEETDVNLLGENSLQRVIHHCRHRPSPRAVTLEGHRSSSPPHPYTCP